MEHLKPKYRFIFGLGFVAALLLFSSIVFAQSVPRQNADLAREIIAELNAWRISQGLWPLAYNATLEALAVGQASYLMTTDIPESGGDFHKDKDGRYPRERAQRPPHNWPNYGTTAEVIIGENAAVGSLQSAFDFWRNSTLHRTASLNPDYREVGVAALPLGGFSQDHLFIVVFGSRPNVLPVEVHPAEGMLYLSNDVSQFAGRTDARINNATTIQLFDANLRPLMADPIPWQARIELPPNASSGLVVRFFNEVTEVDTRVDFSRDLIILPDVAADAVVNVPRGSSGSSGGTSIRESTIIIPPSDLLEKYPAHNRELAFQLIAEVNAMRQQHDLWPLAPNVTLEALALQQASYLLDETDIPALGGDFHTGPSGETPQERAQEAPFDWPTYRDGEVAIGENAAVGTLDFAVKFWTQSMRDRTNIISAQYREVGIAALPYQNGEYLFVMVLGARANVLPALYNPENRTLMLSNEATSAGSEGDLVIGKITSVRLFDSEGKPLSADWLDWQPEIAIPEGVGDKLYVLYTDGSIEALTEVRLDESIALLPTYMDSAVVENNPPAPSATPDPHSVVSASTGVRRTDVVIATNTPRPRG